MTIPTAKAKLLEGKKGLIVGIANDRSIAWGCARAFRALGAEVENPLWGAPRIHGELLKLGFECRQVHGEAPYLRAKAGGHSCGTTRQRSRPWIC